MERFYMSAYTYGAIVYEIECRWGEIRNELDRMAEDAGTIQKIIIRSLSCGRNRHLNSRSGLTKIVEQDLRRMKFTMI